MSIGLNLYPEDNFNNRICPRCGHQNENEIRICENCKKKIPLIVRDALISLKEVEKKFNQLDTFYEHAGGLRVGRKISPIFTLYLIVEKIYSNDDPIAIEFSCEPYLEENEDVFMRYKSEDLGIVLCNVNNREDIFPSGDNMINECFFEPEHKIKPLENPINIAEKFWILVEERLPEDYSIIEISTSPNGYPPTEVTNIAIPGSICCPYCDSNFDSSKIDINSEVCECPNCGKEISIIRYS